LLLSGKWRPLGIQNRLGEQTVSRTSFLLRLDPRVLDALKRWADDELRSVNGQVDYLLQTALRDAGRLKEEDETRGRSRKHKE